MSKTQISPLCDNDCDPIDGGDCIFCRDWNRERRDAWVRFTAAENGTPKQISDWADAMLAEFDARFGKKEEQK
jgi:hypothetical protein